MAAYAQFQVGSAVFPLVSPGAGGTLLATCDPAVSAVLDYLESVLNTYLGTALIDVCSAGGAPISRNVQYKCPVDPGEIMAEVQLQFPLLTVWRKSTKFEEHTANWEHKISTWGVAYVLPPLTGGQLEYVSPILNAVESILQNRIRQAFDPAYQSGAQVFKQAGIEAIWMRTAQFGQFFSEKTQLDFHAWIADVEVKEQITATTAGLSALSGTDVQLFDNSVQPGNPVDLVDFKTDK